ncbi:amino acid adenylation domain-containing protein [Streptomyces sp. NPDC017988]|uniref:amino acid adenylation domain-containing protein n=1 Tax=Streptomyces sp. NPDC017988 TaxID=3365025 RepID=UPI0037990D7F
MPPGPAAPPTETAAPRDVVHAVRAYAAEEPDRPAVKDAGTSLSYAQLLARVETSAGHLVRAGVTPGDRVGIHLPNSADYIVAILACMTVGAVFVPIPYGDPEERIRGIAGDCDVTLTVVPTGHALPEAARRTLRPVGAGELMITEDTKDTKDTENAGGVGNTEGYGDDRDGEDIVYLVYTSGTTGRPKGVMVRRAGLRNFVANTVEVFELTRETRALCVSPFHFDGAFGSIFSVLSVGGSLVVAGHGPLLPGDFFRLLLSEGITHTSFSPSLLRLLTSGRDLPRLAESRLRTVGLGGEDCTPQQIAKLLEHRPDLKVFNRYGPTETTVVVATHLITREWCASGRKIPLGAPDRGVGFHLVDAEGNLVTEPDTPGELCVSGVQVMAGYWGAPEVTRQVLRDDLVPGTTVYRTGDLVRRTPDGLYVYLDRADNVVKRNGNRISMTEVTAALLDVPGVEDAVALVDRPDGRTLIHAFVVAPGLDAAPVRKELLLRVPAYMSPDSLHVVAELPRLSGGKPDARRLRALL